VPERGRFVWRDGVAVALLTVGMMSSGAAIPMLFVVGVVDLVRRGWRVAVATVAFPAVLYGLWYVRWSDTGLPIGSDPAPEQAPEFVWRGITGALGGVARLDAVGYLVAAAVVVWVVWKLMQRPLDPDLLVPGALALGGVVLLASTGWRRGNLPSVGPTTSRYVYMTVAFLLPLVAVAAQGLFRGSTARRVALGVVTVLLVAAQVRVLDREARVQEIGKRQDRGATLATARLAREGHPFLLASPLGLFEPQMTVEKIVEFDRAGKLESLDRATLRDRLTVLARLDVVTGTEGIPDDTPATTAVVGADHASVSPTGDGDCVAVDARPGNRVVFRPSGPTTLTFSAGDAALLRLRRGDTEGAAVVVPASTGDRDRRVRLGAIEGDVVVTFLGRATTVCGLDT